MEIKAYVHAQWCTHSKQYEYHVYRHASMVSVGYVRVGGETTIQFEPHETDMKNATIQAIRDEQKKIRAEAQSKFMQLEESIQSLLAIEHKPEKSDG